jgi:hypothetical protein
VGYLAAPLANINVVKPVMLRWGIAVDEAMAVLI